MKPDDDIKRLVEELRPVQVTKDGPYKRIDQYRDFKIVFDNDIGKRVLSQIIDFCEGHPPLVDSSPQVLAGHIAQRRVGLWILSKLVPPREP